MDVARGADSRSPVGLGEEESKFAAVLAGVNDLAFVDDPVPLCGVAVVQGVVGEDARVVRESVLRGNVVSGGGKRG